MSRTSRENLRALETESGRQSDEGCCGDRSKGDICYGISVFFGEYLTSVGTLLGVTLGLVRSIEHFQGMSGDDGRDYFVDNALKIGTSMGALATSFSVFFKIDLLKIAFPGTYNCCGKKTWILFYILGFGFTMACYWCLALYVSYCTTDAVYDRTIIVASIASAIIILFSFITYCGRWSEDPPSFLPPIEEIEEYEVIEKSCGQTLLELFTMLFAGIALCAGLGIIYLGLEDINNENIFNIDDPSECRRIIYENNTDSSGTSGDNNNNQGSSITINDINLDFILNETYANDTSFINALFDEFEEVFSDNYNNNNDNEVIYNGEDYFDMVLTGCFVCSSAMLRLSDAQLRFRKPSFKIFFGVFLFVPFAYYVVISFINFPMLSALTYTLGGIGVYFAIVFAFININEEQR